MNKIPQKKFTRVKVRNLTPIWEQFFANFSFIMRWLARNFLHEDSRSRLESCGYTYVRKLCRIAKHRGIKESLRLHKEVRNLVFIYLAGGKAEPVAGTGLTFDGLPKILGDLLGHIRKGDTVARRWITTILYSTRWLTMPVSPDLRSITTPTSVNKSVLEDCRSRVPSFWKALGVHKPLSIDQRPAFKKFHLTTKSGPNSSGKSAGSNGNALVSSILDALALKAKPDLIASIATVGGSDLLDKLRTVQETLPRFGRLFYRGLDWNNPAQFKLRKLTAIPDREGKTRVIAILDYWSQTALRPLHNWLFSMLRKIPQDCTFDQGGFRLKLSGGKYFVSADLKDATDRFPIDLIESLLSYPLGKEYANHWRNLMVGHPFTYKGEELYYGAGNPMGAYSSWNSFSIAHHFIVFYVCQLLGKDWHSLQYVILGDDVVIADREVGEMYIGVLGSLGVEVSILKTHKSEHTYEFAKRWIHKGDEISPFPIAGMLDIASRYNLMVNVLQTAEKKEWKPTSSIPEVISDWYSLRKIRRKYTADILDKSILSDAVTRVLTRNWKEGDCLKIITRLCNWPDLIEHFQDGGKYLFQQACIVAFTEAADPKKSKWNLGALAEQLVCAFTDPSFHEDMMVGFNLIQSLPVLQIHGQITDMYLDLKKQALTIDQNKSGAWDWPFFLRNMTVPVTDRVYTARNYGMMLEAAASVGLGVRVVKLLRDFFGLPKPRPTFLQRVIAKID